VAQALRQLDVYGHDGLPVLSPDGQQIGKNRTPFLGSPSCPDLQGNV
jgi:hypothetical protein